MENDPNLLRSPGSYNAEQESKETDTDEDKQESLFKGRRSRRVFARLFKRTQSAKAVNEMQTAQQSAKRTKEQMVAASIDPNLMRRLLKKVKINRRQIKKATKKQKNVEIIDKLDGNLL